MARPFGERIRERLEKTGKSVRRASLDAGLSETALKDLLANEEASPKLSTLEKLAASLEADPAWLAFGVGADQKAAQDATAEADPASLDVVGEVAAGRWLEIDDHVDAAQYEPIPIAPDPRWPAHTQFGLVVRGTSINNVANDGDVLCCVSSEAVARAPSEDDLVIVEQRRFSGQLRERTAKRWRRREQCIELWPDSSDERWQTPIQIPNSTLSAYHGRLYGFEDGTEVYLTGFVTFVIRPVLRSRRGLTPIRPIG